MSLPNENILFLFSPKTSSSFLYNLLSKIFENVNNDSLENPLHTFVLTRNPYERFLSIYNSFYMEAFDRLKYCEMYNISFDINKYNEETLEKKIEMLNELLLNINIVKKTFHVCECNICKYKITPFKCFTQTIFKKEWELFSVDSVPVEHPLWLITWLVRIHKIVLNFKMPLSIDDFLSYYELQINTEEWLYIDLHLKLQTDSYKLPLKNYTFFNNYEILYSKLYDIFKNNDIILNELVKNNEKFKTDNKSVKIINNITETQKKRIYNIFKNDFLLLNYEF